MLSVNKIKGILLITFAIAWMVFIYNFDALMHRPASFNTKATLGFILGIIAFINGIRIYRRDVK